MSVGIKQQCDSNSFIAIENSKSFTFLDTKFENNKNALTSAVVLVIINQFRNRGKAMFVGEKELLVGVFLDVIMFDHSIFNAAAQKKHDDFKQLG